MTWWQISLAVYLVGLVAFARMCVGTSKELADGASGRKLPRWWSDVLCTVCIIVWPVVVIAGLALNANTKQSG